MRLPTSGQPQRRPPAEVVTFDTVATNTRKTDTVTFYQVNSKVRGAFDFSVIDKNQSLLILQMQTEEICE